MHTRSNKLSRFWQELKRRKVLKVIAMYAPTAFIIMEASEIMLPRLGLPDWTVTFLIILLIVAFPITIILSWIFDITGEGLQNLLIASLSNSEELSVRQYETISNIFGSKEDLNYIRGSSHHGKLEYREAIDLYLKARAIDTNFVSAMLK